MDGRIPLSNCLVSWDDLCLFGHEEEALYNSKLLSTSVYLCRPSRWQLEMVVMVGRQAIVSGQGLPPCRGRY